MFGNDFLGSQKSPRSRRQRTTSMNQSSKKTSAESVLRTQHRTIYTAGRPPWYNTAGQQVEPFVIGTFANYFTIAKIVDELFGYLQTRSNDSVKFTNRSKRHFLKSEFLLLVVPESFIWMNKFVQEVFDNLTQLCRSLEN